MPQKHNSKNKSKSSSSPTPTSSQTSLTSFFIPGSEKIASGSLNNNKLNDTAIDNDISIPTTTQTEFNMFSNPSDNDVSAIIADEMTVKPTKRRGRPPKNGIPKNTSNPRTSAISIKQDSSTKVKKGKDYFNPMPDMESNEANALTDINVEVNAFQEPQKDAPDNLQRRSTRAKLRRSYAGMSEDTSNTRDEEYIENGAGSDFSEAEQPDEEVLDYQDDLGSSSLNHGQKKTSGPSAATKYPRLSQPKDVNKSHQLSKKRKMHASILTQIHVIAGHGADAVNRVVSMREKWDNYMFIPGKDSIGKGVVTPSSEYGAPVKLQNSEKFSQELRKLSKKDAAKYLILSNQPEIQVNELKIPTFQSINTREGHSFNGSILNAGGVVTSISWAQGMENPKEQYLAVGILDDYDRDPIKSTIVAPEISIFSKNAYPSSIYIYKVDLTEQESENTIVKLVYTLSGDFGSCIKLEWRPVNGSSDILEGSLGHLAILSQDGGLRVYNMPTEDSNEVVHLYAEKPLREYKVYESSKITTFCWRTSEVLLVATSDGLIGEFNITDWTVKHRHLPSFLIPIFDSAVICLSSGYPNNSNLVFGSSTNGYSCIFDIRNPTYRNYNHRRKGYSSAATYSPHFEAFVLADENHFTQASFVRFFKAHMHSNSLTKHQALVTSIDISPFHPFVLSGSADGSVNTGNMNRRILARKRVKDQPYEQGILWAVDYNSKLGTYKIEAKYSSMALEKPKMMPIQQMYPPNVTIKDIKWSKCESSAEWYAAVTTGGIIKFQRSAAIE